jgi:hypothetical protein
LSRYGRLAVKKLDFGEIFCGVWEKSMNSTNTNAGFHATGIFSYDLHILPPESYSSSAAPEVALPEEDEVCRLKRIQQ